MRPSPFIATLIVSSFPAWLGCTASIDARAKVGGVDDTEDAPPLFEEPLESNGNGNGNGNGDDDLAPPALIGARHDLIYAGPREAVCRCLAVAIGQARQPKFRWSAERPKTDPDSQLVIAFSAEGVPCEARPGGASLGPSYWGYETKGNDVIVIVEELSRSEPSSTGASKPSPPVTAGAIIPKPLGDGEVYVRPVTKDIPYGKPLDGTGELCRVGNVGQKRTGPGAAPGEGGVRLGPPPGEARPMR